MNEETIAGFLEGLASGAPVPGGGGAAALSAAMGAALVAMVCNLTLGQEKYRAHEELMARVLVEATEQRALALALAEEDGAAYGAVRAAYSLPRATDEEKAARQAGIQDALKGAADVPLRTVAVAARIVELCAEALPGGNPNVVSDVGVGVLCARAALDGAALNVRINLALIKDEGYKGRTAAELERRLAAARPRADEVARGVEKGIGR
jgi:formiminotetrahydrofolate cyclodeaminase